MRDPGKGGSRRRPRVFGIPQPGCLKAARVASQRPASARLWILAPVLALGAFPFLPIGHPPAQHAPGKNGDLTPPAEPARRPPSDPLFRYQWHLRAMQIPEAWSASRGAGATVAVLDTGVAYENAGRYRRAPDLAGTDFVPGWDFVDGDAHPNDDLLPGRQAHGTHLAGVISQTTDNGLGAAGVAPKAKIMPIRVLGRDGNGSVETIARALRFAADHGADVANLSFAGPTGSKALADAVTYATSKGVTIVASAGNDGSPSVSFPAAYSQVIAVGAVGLDQQRAYYSSYGKGLDLVAPGGDSTADRDGDGSGDGVLQQSLRDDASTFCYCFIASTSAAAAHVAGAAALLVGSGRATRPAEVRSALLASAHDLGPPASDPEYGAGLVQASSALAAADSGRPWLVWIGLALAGVLLVGLLGLTRRRRQRLSR